MMADLGLKYPVNLTNLLLQQLILFKYSPYQHYQVVTICFLSFQIFFND